MNVLTANGSHGVVKLRASSRLPRQHNRGKAHRLSPPRPALGLSVAPIVGKPK